MTPYVGMRSSIHTVHFFVQDNCETRSDTLDTAGWSKSKTTKVEKGRGSTELVVVSTRPCQHWCSVLGLLRSGSRALPVVALPWSPCCQTAASAPLSHMIDARSFVEYAAWRIPMCQQPSPQLSRIHLYQSLAVRKTFFDFGGKKEDDQISPCAPKCQLSARFINICKEIGHPQYTFVKSVRGWT